MKKIVIGTLIVLMVSSYAWALTDADGVKLNGQHYNLNIIGVQNPKKADMDGENMGGVIFVNLNGKSKIGLIESTEAGLDADEYAVLDKNGTDGDGALLALPDPGLDPYIVGDDMTGVDTMSDYSVFVCPKGKPLGYAKITTCAEVVESKFMEYFDKDGVTVLNDAAYFGGVCSIEQVGEDITFRNKGKTTFTNVTAELLTIVLKVEVWVDANENDVEDEGETEIVYARIPIFDDILEGEYWEYDNYGLKLLQVRFYPMQTDVSEGDPDLPPL